MLRHAAVLLMGLGVAGSVSSAARGEDKPPQAAEAPSHRPEDFRTEFQQSLMPLPDAKSLTVRGNIYVPAYATIRGISDRGGTGVANVLRIDNTSATKPLVLERLDYFDTSGKLIQRYLDAPIALKSFGAIQITVPPEDHRGGAAANFIIGWAGAAPMAEPLVQALAFSTGTGSVYSFDSPGRPIHVVGKRQWLSFGLTR